MQKRKIGFYWLHIVNNNGEEETFYNVESYLPCLLEFMCNLEKVSRKLNINNDKFCFIDFSSYAEDTHSSTLLLKSAKHSYRAPLLDKNTVEARENPKRMEEGEQIKTHAYLKYKEDDAIVFLETGQNILSLQNVCDYLNHFIPSYNQSHEDIAIPGLFTFDMIPRDDFREVLDSMSRVVCADIFISKMLLGSDSLNFSNSTNDIQENMILTLKSEKKKSIKTTLYDLVNKYSGGTSSINRIRIKGKLQNNNDSVIDTSFIIKKEYIEVEQNQDTGEFNTPSMFLQLELLSHDY